MSAIDELIPRLHRVRRALQRAVLERRIATTVSVVILCFVVMAMADRTLRFPVGLRWTTLILGLGWLGWSIRTHLWSAIRFRPTLVDVALRIETLAPPLAGRLASGVEFATSDVGNANPLAARALRDLQHRVSTVKFEEIVDARRAHQLLAVAIFAGLMLTSLVLWRPVDASIATKRVLAPWTDARWPARTEVVGLLDTDLVHARGEPLAMAAELVRGDLEGDRVFLNIRNIRDGVKGDWQRLVLTRQQGRRFERVIDTDADEIEYSFATDEVETDSSTIRLFPAPQISTAMAIVTPPTYASSRGEIQAELGSGTDRRSRLTEPALEGSRLKLDLTLTRPVPVDRAEDGGVSRSFIEKTLMVPDEARVDLERLIRPIQLVGRSRSCWSVVAILVCRLLTSTVSRTSIPSGIEWTRFLIARRPPPSADQQPTKLFRSMRWWRFRRKLETMSAFNRSRSKQLWFEVASTHKSS